MKAKRAAKSQTKPKIAAKKSAKKSAAPDKLSAADKAQYKALLAKMDSARKGESFAFDRYWEAIDEILFRDLWRADSSSADVRAWITAHTGESTTVAYKNCRVARHATGEDIARYRPSAIDAALTYIETRDDQTLPHNAKVNLGALLIPVGKGKKQRMNALDAVTVAQIEEAIEALRPKQKRAATSPSEQALVGAFAKRKTLSGARASVRDGMLSIKNVALTSVPALIEALRELESGS